MNSVVLIGRLARDPEVRYTPGSQMAVARFTVAVDRGYSKDQNQTADFISCVAFGKTAEFIEKYFNKGKLIGIQGRIQTGSYVNKDGNKVYTTDVVADKVEFVGSKSETGGGNGNYGGGSYGNSDMGNNANDGGFPSGFESIDDDEMPF